MLIAVLWSGAHEICRRALANKVETAHQLTAEAALDRRVDVCSSGLPVSGT